MKREVEYHEVKVRFIVSDRELRRAVDTNHKGDARSRLASMIHDALGGNGMNCMDAEEVSIEINDKAILGNPKGDASK